jgi:hypothetical protein
VLAHISRHVGNDRIQKSLFFGQFFFLRQLQSFVLAPKIDQKLYQAGQRLLKKGVQSWTKERIKAPLYFEKHVKGFVYQLEQRHASSICGEPYSPEIRVPLPEKLRGKRAARRRHEKIESTHRCREFSPGVGARATALSEKRTFFREKFSEKNIALLIPLAVFLQKPAQPEAAPESTGNLGPSVCKRSLTDAASLVLL